MIAMQDDGSKSGYGPLTRRAILAGLSGGLAGCMGAAAPVSVRAGGVMPPPVRDGVFWMPDGAGLPYRVWAPVGPPQRVVLALHGFGDSRDAWELPAPVFAAVGTALFAPDQRGFGETAARGRWVGAARMVADAACMVAQLRELHGEVPLFLMGESMGGAVAMCLAAERHLAVAGMVLVAPAVWGRASMNVLLRSGLWLISHTLPSVTVLDGGPVRVHATDNLAALRRLSRDPLSLHSTRFATLRGLVDLMDAAVAAAPAMPAPTLCLYGGKDEVIPPEAMAAVWRSLPPPPGVRRAFYPDGYHMLLRDLGRSAPIGDIVAWMADPRARLPSGAERAGALWLAHQA